MCRFSRSLLVLVTGLFKLFCLAVVADELEAGLSRAEAYVRQGDLKKAEQELLALAKKQSAVLYCSEQLGYDLHVAAALRGGLPAVCCGCGTEPEAGRLSGEPWHL